MHVNIKNRRVYLMSSNGKILNFSEQYSREWNAKRAAKRMFPELPRKDSKGRVF